MEKTELEQEKDHFEEDYKKFEFELPDLRKLKEDFDVEKVYDKDSEFLLRSIRRVISEKITAYSQLFETLMNPSSPPMFIYSLIRNLDEKDKELIKEVYSKLSKIQISAIKLDTIYSQESEAKFILDTFNAWQDIKESVYALFDRLEKNAGNEKESARRAYLG